MSIASELTRLRIKRQSLLLDETDYYTFRSKKPQTPKPGYLLLTRVPRSTFFSVIWSNGESLKLISSQSDLQKLAQFGVEKEKGEKALNHLWNFGAVYVAKKAGFPDAPPSMIPVSL